MGESLLHSSSNGKTETGSTDIQQTLDELSADWSKLDRLWASKKQRLEQGVELQRLNQEGDRIEATLSGHEARLKVKDVGVKTPRLFSARGCVVGKAAGANLVSVLLQDSVDSVRSLLGRQEELEGLLKALDQRVDLFTERSRELIDQRHYAAKK